MAGEVVQGGFKTTRRWLNKRLLLAVAIIFCVIVVGLAGWLVYRHYNHNKENQNTAFTMMISESSRLSTSGSYALAEQVVQQYLNKYPSTSHRRETYLQMANIYSSAGNDRQVLVWYQKVFNMDKNPQVDVVSGLAYVYQALRDYPNAIKYFKQAITLTQASNDLMKDSQIGTYKYLIQQMGGSI